MPRPESNPRPLDHDSNAKPYSFPTQDNTIVASDFERYTSTLRGLYDGVLYMLGLLRDFAAYLLFTGDDETKLKNNR